MTFRTAPVLAAVASTLVAAALAGCAAQTPEERLTAVRADYQADLNSFRVVEEPIVQPDVTTVEESAAHPDVEATGPVGVEPQVRQDVVLDIVIDNRSDERLPGITLDVEQVDTQGQAKTSYRIWADTSGILPGARGAVAHRLEDVDYAPGEGFRVEVRQAIPPEERGQYREFDEAGEQP